MHGLRRRAARGKHHSWSLMAAIAASAALAVAVPAAAHGGAGPAATLAPAGPARAIVLTAATRPQVAPKPGRIAGTVRAASTRRPLAGVTVQVTALRKGGLTTHARTSVAGTYSVGKLAPGSYSVCFYAPPTGIQYVSQCFRGKPADGSAVPTKVAVLSGKAVTITAALTLAGSITGTVSSAASGNGVGGVEVSVTSARSHAVSYATASAKGTYAVTGLAAGTYAVCFDAATATANGFVAQCYRGQPGDGLGHPTAVVVSSGKATRNINARLAADGSISGTVTAAASGGLAGIDVEVSPAGGSGAAAYTVTHAGGSYAVHNLTPGSYTVCFYPPAQDTTGLVAQCYNAEPADGSGTPDPVTVTGGTTTAGINAQLARTGSIAGTVTNAATSSPVGGATVEVFPSGGTGTQEDATTGTDGTYSVTGLAAGTYTVCFFASTLVPQCYDDQPVTGTPVPVTVTGGTATTGINAALAATGGITGTVTDAATAAPVSGVTVEITDTDGSSASYVTTGADGTYSASGLAAGTYSVCFYPPASSASGYQPQCYNAEPADGSVTPDPVTVTAGATTSSINAALAAGGSISGTVTDAATSVPLAGVEVDVYPAGNTGIGGTATTGADGTYSIGALVAGQYSVCFYPPGPYLAQCYNTEPADGSVSPDPVTVTGGAASTGINAAVAQP